MIGIGTDIVSIKRIEAALQRHGRRFAERILAPSEMEVFCTSSNGAAYLAKRFAAKEAASKALGTGIGKVSWQDFRVVNNSAGAPQLELGGSAMQLMDSLGGRRALLSLADEKDYVVAFVVID